jgi:streptomycin 6-kinase
MAFLCQKRRLQRYSKGVRLAATYLERTRKVRPFHADSESGNCLGSSERVGCAYRHGNKRAEAIEPWVMEDVL